VRAAAAAVLLTLSASPAFAHPAPFSYLDVRIADARIEGSLLLHTIDVAHDLGVAPAERLLEPAFAREQFPRIAALVDARLAFGSSGRSLPIEWRELAPVPERQGVRLSFEIAETQPASLTIAARLFPYDPFHQTFLNVYERGALRMQAIFDARSSGARTFYAGSMQGTLAVVRTFVASGVHHILIGPDHILFLVALLLLGGGAWPLVRIVTAFTVGHSITLSLAALGVVTPPASLVEPAIALSIVFVGADNLLVGEKGRDLRAWAALVFGLIHGFGFASVLREFGLPREALGWSLFSFNVGVEVGQLVIVVLVAGALFAVRRRSPALGRRLAFAGSLVVVAAGAYWFVERVLFPGGTS
jgi:hydrogenase/urease accessory protein HupE